MLLRTILAYNNILDLGEFEHMIRHQLKIEHTCDCAFCMNKKAAAEAADKSATVICVLRNVPARVHWHSCILRILSKRWDLGFNSLLSSLSLRIPHRRLVVALPALEVCCKSTKTRSQTHTFTGRGG
jgi:hypothetical protein